MRCQPLHEALGDQHELRSSTTHPSTQPTPAHSTSPQAEPSLTDIEKSQIAKDLVSRAQLAAQDTDLGQHRAPPTLSLRDPSLNSK